MLRERHTQNNYYNHEFSSKFASIAIYYMLFILYIIISRTYHATPCPYSYKNRKNCTKSKCL